MPKPIDELTKRLKDVEELIAAHEAVTGGGKGKPIGGQGTAITRAGIVLLNASFEAFIENTFDASVESVFVNELSTPKEKKEFLQKTSRKMHSADVDNINFRFANIGYPFILNGISWQGYTNISLKRDISELNLARNKIAH